VARLPAGPVAAALFAAALAVYLGNGAILPGNDAAPNVAMAVNLVEEGRLTLTPGRDPALFIWDLRTSQGIRSSYLTSPDVLIGGVPMAELRARGVLTWRPPYYLLRAAGQDPASGEPRFAGTFGPGPALAAAPVFLAARLSGPLSGDPLRAWNVAKLAAALLSAGAVATTWLACRRLASPGSALVLAGAVAFGTPLWSSTSQALWQHAPNTLFLALGALALLEARERWLHAALAGLAFAAATACRPTSALFLAAAGLFLLWANPRRALAFAAGALPVLAAQAAWNQYAFGAVLASGQLRVGASVALQKTGSADPWQTPLLEGLAGVLLSPSRGLLVFSPFLALAVAGAVLAARRRAPAPLLPLALAAAAVVLVEARWFDWWGGWAYGPRRLGDLAPVLALLAAPAMGWVAAARWRRAMLGAAVGWAVLVQAVGALAYDVDGWNARREGAGVALDVDRPEHRHRLWSLSDSQIGYYLGHFREARERKAVEQRRWLERFQAAPQIDSPRRTR
jgi:hypothetical protein